MVVVEERVKMEYLKDVKEDVFYVKVIKGIKRLLGYFFVIFLKKLKLVILNYKKKFKKRVL